MRCTTQRVASACNSNLWVVRLIALGQRELAYACTTSARLHSTAQAGWRSRCMRLSLSSAARLQCHCRGALLCPPTAAGDDQQEVSQRRSTGSSSDLLVWPPLVSEPPSGYTSKPLPLPVLTYAVTGAVLASERPVQQHGVVWSSASLQLSP